MRATTYYQGSSSVSRRAIVATGGMAVYGIGAAGVAGARGRGSVTASADVLDQVDPATEQRELYAADSATIRRTSHGISTKISMPTPEPGTYRYPEPSETATNEEGPPEAFTLWVFVFDDALGGFDDHPWSGAFLGAGHIVSGSTLTLSGHVSKRTDPFLGHQLAHPFDSKVHLAVAPHGAADSELLPGQLQTPAGTSDLWWVAQFETG